MLFTFLVFGIGLISCDDPAMMRQAAISNPDPIGPEPPVSPPSRVGAIALHPGDCLQAVVDSAPEGATFLIESGRHEPRTSKSLGATDDPPTSECD